MSSPAILGRVSSTAIIKKYNCITKANKKWFRFYYFSSLLLLLLLFTCLMPVTLFKRLWESDSYYNSTSFRKIIILSCVLCCIPNREMAWNETKGVYNENEALQSILNIIFHFVWWLQSTLMMMGFNYFPWRPHVYITQLNNKRRRINVEVFILDTLLMDRCVKGGHCVECSRKLTYYWLQTTFIDMTLDTFQTKVFFDSFLNFKHFSLSFFLIAGELEIAFKYL